MAPQNQGQRIDDLDEGLKKLTTFVNELHLQLSNFMTEVKLAMPGYGETARKANEMDKAISLLQKEMENLGKLKEHPELIIALKGSLELLSKDLVELVKWKDDVKKSADDRMKMAWMVVPPLVAAFLTGAINFGLFMYFKK